jgi:hypothetical protein
VKSNELTPRNPANIRASDEPGAVQLRLWTHLLSGKG